MAAVNTLPAVNTSLEVKPGPGSRKQIEKLSGQKIGTCYQCEKCTNGCPMTFAMDIMPHQVMHSLQLGLSDEMAKTDTIWVCASCETCTTRCPNEIDIAHVMDTLRQMSMKKGVKTAHKQAPVFHSVFLNSVKRFGRMHEATLAVEYALRSGGLQGLRKQMGLGLDMMRKGKLKIIPSRLRAGKGVDDIFRTAKRK
jgi:heterodisulfide reductase subunit C